MIIEVKKKSIADHGQFRAFIRVYIALSKHEEGRQNSRRANPRRRSREFAQLSRTLPTLRVEFGVGHYVY